MTDQPPTTELSELTGSPASCSLVRFVDETRPALISAPAPVIKGKSGAQFAEAARRLPLVETYRSLLAEGKSPKQAVRLMNAAGIEVSRSTLDRWKTDLEAHGFEGLIDNRDRRGRKRKYDLTDQETSALRARRLGTNRTECDGSTPEAVRAAIRHGEIRQELADEFLERDRTGRMVPESIHRDIAAPAAVTKQFRSPTEAALDYLNAPGTLMFITDRSGEQRFVRAGDVLEADDATVNFYVCIPWEMGGCPCSEKYGVKIARFQWLVAIDRASRFVPGYSYTMRPKSSYRAEDVVSLFQTIFRQHGVWQRLCLERGVWESNRVGDLLTQLGVERITAWSPHQKPVIEGLFNLMWTKLSEMPGQVGRFAGDEEATEAVAESCRRGATDPRLHFPMLAAALPAFDRAIAERNSQAVKSTQYGTWIPQERWLAQQQEAREKRRLRPLPAEAAWMFAPCVREWTVRGNCVGGSVQLIEGCSTRFDFSRDDLVEYDGCLVRAYFDPFAQRADAMLVLAENARSGRKDEVLGTAVQVNQTASYARRVLGYGDDANLANELRKQNAKGLRREVRTIEAGGKTGLTISELRDAEGNQIKIERSTGEADQAPGIRDQASSIASSPIPDPRSQIPAARSHTRDLATALRPATPDQYEKQRAHRARLAEAGQLLADKTE